MTCALQSDFEVEKSEKEAAQQRAQGLEVQLAEEIQRSQRARAICRAAQDSFSLKNSECAGLRDKYEKAKQDLRSVSRRAQQLERLNAHMRTGQPQLQVSLIHKSSCLTCHCGFWYAVALGLGNLRSR